MIEITNESENALREFFQNVKNLKQPFSVLINNDRYVYVHKIGKFLMFKNNNTHTADETLNTDKMIERIKSFRDGKNKI